MIYRRNKYGVYNLTREILYFNDGRVFINRDSKEVIDIIYKHIYKREEYRKLIAEIDNKLLTEVGF